MPTLEEITDATARAFGFTPEEIRGPARTADIVRARQCAISLAREKTGASLTALGSHFGGRDHTTILHHMRTWATRRSAPDMADRENAAREITLGAIWHGGTFIPVFQSRRAAP